MRQTFDPERYERISLWLAKRRSGLPERVLKERIYRYLYLDDLAFERYAGGPPATLHEPQPVLPGWVARVSDGFVTWSHVPCPILMASCATIGGDVSGRCPHFSKGAYEPRCLHPGRNLGKFQETS